MSDELALRKDMDRAAKAESLLTSPLLTEAFDVLRDAYVKAWEESAARDTDGRERLWQAVQVVGKVRSHLQMVVDGGKVAQKHIDELTERKKLLGLI